MAIGKEFGGLDMKELIGGPLAAAAAGSTLLANSTANFIKTVGFDEAGKLRTVAFAYQKRSVNEDGTTNMDEMKIDMPLLAIVPIPNLQVDEVNILFDMEVKQSESSHEALDVGATLTGSLGIGPVKVSISGSVSVHKENTRSSDNSAKYHVDVRATNHGTPEGLARVLDMMAANVAPTLVGTAIKDSNGQDLQEAARIKAEKLKKLRHETSRIETRLNAAGGRLEDCVVLLKRVASTQQNVYQAEMSRLLVDAKEGEEEEYAKVMGMVNDSWNNLQNNAASMIQIIADDVKENAAAVSDLFGLQALKKGKVSKYEPGESQYNALLQAQNNAVKAQKAVLSIEKELFDKRAEYSDAVAGVNTSTDKPAKNPTEPPQK